VPPPPPLPWPAQPTSSTASTARSAHASASTHRRWPLEHARADAREQRRRAGERGV
jgi:hypothetical protein